MKLKQKLNSVFSMKWLNFIAKCNRRLLIDYRKLLIPITKKITLFFLTLTIFSCASVPKESVTLSKALGVSISDTEVAHLNLMSQFFDDKRAEIDDVINRVYVPTFTDEFFSLPEVKKKWESVCEDSEDEKLKFMSTVGIKIQKKINEKREELLQPLNETERLLEMDLLNHYNELRFINSTLSNYLVSSSNVKNQQVKLLTMLGIEEQKYNDAVEGMLSVINNINGKVDALELGEEQAKEYLKELKDLKNKLTKPISNAK